MRYIHFILALIASIVVSACTTTDIDVYVDPTDTPTHGGDLQVVGRITQYTDCDVATRSKKEGDESKVTSMGLALFPIENGSIGNCLYYDYKLGGSIVFIVDRHDAVFNNYENTQFAMYIFANMQDAVGFPTTAEAGVGKSLDYFTKCAAAASEKVKDVPANGFPMMGSLGNNVQAVDADGGELILKPTQTDANVDGLPLVDGKPTDNLEIPLKSMYAKFSFTISVKPDQEIVGNKAPRFDLLSYEVNNIPATVDSNSSTNDDNAVIASSGAVSMGNYAQGATTATFNFYLPERYLTPSKTNINDVLPDALKKGTYGTDVDADQNGYRDEDERYHQRYKNLLPGDNQKATYVTISGKYTDHQGHPYDVDYNIYLGGNNVDNFEIIRNTHYDNSVTIRGISTSSDQVENEEAISIDWRVNVDRESTPLVINLRRESLLDAHYEVRPLRLRLVGENITTGTSAIVQILNQDGTTNDIPGWIRLEASGNSGDHITTGVSAGKRKYFTTDLVTSTLKDNTSIENIAMTADNQTIWIYVDENTTTTSRAAIVRVSYQGVNKDFKIVQNGLYSVVGAESGRTYYIEQYEEYLYNYDAEDSYGQTKQEGMPWGLIGVQLSNEHNSFYVDEDNTDWNNYVANNPLLKYDFYIAKYDAFVRDGVTVHGFAGQHFTQEIFDATKNDTDIDKKVNVLTMADQPQGAVEYCYNRNKRDANGNVVKVEWYLPSADELEDFIVPAYASFEEFQDNYYWTSQPAYIRDAFYYQYATGSSKDRNITDAYAFVAYEDNTQYARATKVVAKGNNVYEYALSGLNKIPTDAHINSGCENEQLLDNAYFTNMYAWYRWNGGTDPQEWTEDTHYNEKKNGSETSVRYHVHVGHTFDKMYQKDENGEHGYHPRTKSNRVRCARRDWNPDNNYEMEIVYTTVSTTTLDKSGNTVYVMKNTNYSTYLTTSGDNVAASDAAVGINNLVVIEGNKIKSVAKKQYFYGDDSDVSFDNTGTSYTISNSSGSNFTISCKTGIIITRTYYLRQTSDSQITMSTTNNDNTWQFYEVKKEYVVKQ